MLNWRNLSDLKHLIQPSISLQILCSSWNSSHIMYFTSTIICSIFDTQTIINIYPLLQKRLTIKHHIQKKYLKTIDNKLHLAVFGTDFTMNIVNTEQEYTMQINHMNGNKLQKHSIYKTEK